MGHHKELKLFQKETSSLRLQKEVTLNICNACSFKKHVRFLLEYADPSGSAIGGTTLNERSRHQKWGLLSLVLSLPHKLLVVKGSSDLVGDTFIADS